MPTDEKHIAAEGEATVGESPRARLRWRRWIVILVIVAAALHVTVLVRETSRRHSAAGLATILWPDEKNYYVLLADGVAEHGAEFLKDERMLRSPPLPWLWLFLWHRNIVLTRFANIALVILGSYLIAAIARSRWGDRAGVAAFVLCACGYQVVLYAGTVLTEPLALFFSCLLLWAMDHLARSATQPKTGTFRAVGYAALAGIACGLAALSRTSLQLLPLAVVGLWLLSRLAGRRSRQSAPDLRIWHVGLILLCDVAIVGPVIAWNYKTLGVARIANGFGAVMYLGSDLRTNGDEPAFCGMQFQTHLVTGQYDHLQTRGDELLMKAAMENIRRHPFRWLELCAPKIGRVAIGGPGYHFMPGSSYRTKARLVGGAETAIVFAWWTVAGTVVAVFGVAGLARMWRQQPAAALAATAITAYLVALHMISFSMPRFGLPFYPALVLGCCAFFAGRQRWRVTAPIVLICAAIPAYLALGDYIVPPAVVSAEKPDDFTIDRTFGGLGETMPATVSLGDGGFEPAFNTCLFVRVRAEGRDVDRKVVGVLHLRPQGAAEFDDASRLAFPIVPDGRRKTYQLCTESQAAWRGKRWAELRFSILPVGGATIHDLEITIAH